MIVTPALPPTLENTTEVGVRYSSRRLSGSLALFLMNVRDQITFDPITLQPNPGGSTRQQGAELDGTAMLNSWLGLFAHATVNDAHYVKLITDSGVDLSGTEVFQVANATVQYGFNFYRSSFLGSLWAAYTGPWVPVNEPGVLTRAYTLLNFRATVPLSGLWSGVVAAQNILDTRYVEVQASGYVSPGLPTTVMLTIQHNY